MFASAKSKVASLTVQDESWPSLVPICAKPLPFPRHTKQGAWLIKYCEHHHYYIYHSHQNKCNQSSPRSSGSSAVVHLTNKLIIPVPCDSFCILNCFTTILLLYSATPGPIRHWTKYNVPTVPNYIHCCVLLNATCLIHSNKHTEPSVLPSRRMLECSFRQP